VRMKAKQMDQNWNQKRAQKHSLKPMQECKLI
jgi:hypothetical protein